MSSYSLIFVMLVATLSNVGAVSWLAIRYPGLADDYVRQLKDFKRIPSQFSLIDMNRESREEICKEVLNAIIFQYQTLDEPWPKEFVSTEEYDYASLVSRVITFYEESLLPSFRKFLLTVDVGSMIILLYAVPCSILDSVGDSWFLAAGFDENSLLLLTRRSDSENYVIMGHLEPSPIVSQLNVEMCFLRDLKKVTEISHRRSVCSLNAIQKFRLCSSVFRVYSSRNEAVNYFRGDPECMENTQISFSSLDPTSMGFDEPILVDLLPCAVNQTWFSPKKFYVTADPKVWHAVYVVVLSRFQDDISLLTQDQPAEKRERRRRKIYFNIESPEDEESPRTISSMLKNAETPTTSSNILESAETPRTSSNMPVENAATPRTSSKVLESAETPRTSSGKPLRNYFMVMHITEINVLRYEPL